MCLNHEIAALKAAKRNLPDSKLDFASSLIAQFENGKKPLSEKQVYWVKKLAEIPAKKTDPTVLVDDSFKSVLAVFDKAKLKLKRPRIRLALPTGEAVLLSLAPKDGNNPGFIYLRIDNEYSGKISPSGAFSPFNLADAAIDNVKALFSLLGANPAKIAADYGKETGECCFCGKTITTDESLAVGYGPDCAESYGLPWGDVEVVSCPIEGNEDLSGTD